MARALAIADVGFKKTSCDNKIKTEMIRIQEIVLLFLVGVVAWKLQEQAGAKTEKFVIPTESLSYGRKDPNTAPYGPKPRVDQMLMDTTGTFLYKKPDLVQEDNRVFLAEPERPSIR